MFLYQCSIGGNFFACKSRNLNSSSRGRRSKSSICVGFEFVDHKSQRNAESSTPILDGNIALPLCILFRQCLPQAEWHSKKDVQTWGVQSNFSGWVPTADRYQWGVVHINTLTISVRSLDIVCWPDSHQSGHQASNSPPPWNIPANLCTCWVGTIHFSVFSLWLFTSSCQYIFSWFFLPVTLCDFALFCLFVFVCCLFVFVLHFLTSPGFL